MYYIMNDLLRAIQEVTLKLYNAQGSETIPNTNVEVNTPPPPSQSDYAFSGGKGLDDEVSPLSQMQTCKCAERQSMLLNTGDVVTYRSAVRP